MVAMAIPGKAPAGQMQRRLDLGVKRTAPGMEQQQRAEAAAHGENMLFFFPRSELRVRWLLCFGSVEEASSCGHLWFCRCFFSFKGVELMRKEAWRGPGMDVVADELTVTVSEGRKLLDHVAASFA